MTPSLLHIQCDSAILIIIILKPQCCGLFLNQTLNSKEILPVWGTEDCSSFSSFSTPSLYTVLKIMVFFKTWITKQIHKFTRFTAHCVHRRMLTWQRTTFIQLLWETYSTSIHTKYLQKYIFVAREKERIPNCNQTLSVYSS